ncbi:hypothetical protein E4U53_003741 [Claviceps sorghi]|nr:hypothetical protein E4U53_003741 [Claviceps sorghi]
MQIRYVNKALQRFDSTQVIPIQFVLFTLCVILGSAVLYRDFEKTTPKQAAYFVGGCLLTFFGVFLITSGRQQKEQDDEDLLSEIDGIEENIGLSRHEQEALVLGAQEPSSPVTPHSRSRRSSRISRKCFTDTAKPEAPEDRGVVPALEQRGQREASDSAPHVIQNEPPTTTEEIPRQETWSSSLSLASRGNRTASAADVAATESVSRPVTGGSSDMTTAMRDQESAAAAAGLYPSEPPAASRPGPGVPRSNSHHRSKTFISPSPLSSTVTTVVKDGFLGEKSRSWAHRPSLRRIRSSIRASLFFNDDHEEHNAGPSGYASLSASGAKSSAPSGERSGFGRDGLGNDAPRSRSQSLSDALGGFFRSTRKNDTIGSKKDVKMASCRNDALGSDEDI